MNSKRIICANATLQLLSLVVSLLCVFTSKAQVFPVQATTQLAPPYSLYLSDYVESGTERLALNVFLKDVARPELNVRFRLRIVGQGITLETKPEYIPPPISIQGGVPLRLISTDLAEYFNPNNLNFQGITKRDYERKGKLPEGVYQFCFEVLEYNRGLKISNTACATAWLILNDPPIINLPRQNEKLKYQSPQNVLIQWTPRHTGSPNSAFTTEYEIKMVEVWPNTRNPNDAILTSPPIYEATTQSTTVIYGPAETPLEPGRRYAFQVRAKSISGVDELDLFKNNGYSEVYSFVYGDACDLPTGISVKSLSSSRFGLGWDGLFNHTAYRIRYREAGTSNWYDNNSAINAFEVTSLRPNTKYEYQIASTCGILDGEYSPIGTVTTEPAPETSYSCGVPLETFNLDPSQLTGSLKPGDVIQAGDFDVRLVTVTGSNGTFTGEGVIEVPYFNKAKVKVSFSNIQVNKELHLVHGFMNVTGADVDIVPSGVINFRDKLTETLNTVDSALNTIEENLPEQFDPNSFVADTLINVKEGIHSVYKNEDGSITVVDKNGNTQQLPQGKNYAVKDDLGNGYLIDSKGNIHKVTADVAAKAGSREYNLKLKFTPTSITKYGFDERQHDALAKDYEQLKDNYKVAWKALGAGVTDQVAAKLDDPSINKSKIQFELGGQPLSSTPFTNNSTDLILTGKSDGTIESVLALYNTGDTTKKEQVLGKLNVVSYNGISHSLVIVPVNTVTLPNGLTDQAISTQLNAIYNQAVVDWKVSIASPVEVDLNAQFDDGESGVLSNYTEDMKKVIKAYGKLQDETYYIFLVKNPKSVTGLGYMPRGKQAGFVFVDKHGSNEALVRTIAHELGHGAFNLHHTFQEPNFTLTKGATDNLMDYPAGNKLYKYQWDKIRHPDIVLDLFEEDEEGENIVVLNMFPEQFLNKDKATFTFLTPAGSVIVLPKNIANVSFTHSIYSKNYLDNITGTLASFSIVSFLDGKPVEKRFDILNQNGTFLYATENRRDTYIDELTPNVSPESFIMGLPGADGFKVHKFKTPADIERYSISGNRVISEEDIKVRLFTLNSQEGEPLVFEYGSSNPIRGEDQIQISTEELEAIDGFFSKPEILLLTKIGQLRHAYPALFSEFTKNFNLWTDYSNAAAKILTVLAPTPVSSADRIKAVAGTFDFQFYANDTLRQLWDSDKYSFYVQFLSLLKTHVEENTALVHQFINSVTADSDRLQVINAVSKLSQKEIEALPEVKRITLLSIIANGCTHDGEERLILKLIKYQPRGEHNQLLHAEKVLEALVSASETNEDKLLLDQIIHGSLGCGLDDETVLVGNNNYLELMGLIINMCYSSETFWIKATENNADITKHTVEYQYRGFWKRTYDELINTATGHYIVWKPSYIKTSVDVDEKYNITVHHNYWNGYFNNLGEAFPDESFSPYDPVVLINKSGLSLTNGFGYRTYKDYDAALKDKDRPVLVLPAIILKYIESKADLETTGDAVMAAVDVATIWTGYGALMKGVTGLRRALVIADMTSSGLSITASSIDPNAYPNLKKVLQGTSAVLGVVSLTPTGEAKDLKSIYEAIKSTDNILTIKQVEDFADAVIAAQTASLKNMPDSYVKQTKAAIEIMIKEAEVTQQASLLSKLTEAKQVMNGISGIATGASLTTKIASLTKKFNTATQSWLEALEHSGRIVLKPNGANKWDVIFNYFKKTSSGIAEAIPTESKIAEAVEESGIMQLHANRLDESLASTTADDIIEYADDIEFKDIQGNPHVGGAIVCKGVCGLDPAGCFAAGTTVLVSENNPTPIEKLKVGEKVLSYDSISNRIVNSKITQVITKGVTKLVKVFAKGKSLLTTPNHPIYTTKGMMSAGYLKAGMMLLTLSGSPVSVDSISTVDTLATVYNIEVADVHNYYAGELEILVHNGDCFAKKYPAINTALNNLNDSQIRNSFVRGVKDPTVLAAFESGELSVSTYAVLKKADCKLIFSDYSRIKKFQGLAQNVQTKVAKLADKEPPSTLLKFLDDIDAPALAAKVSGDPTKVLPAWEALYKANVEEAVRRGTNGQIEFVIKYIEDYPTKKVAEEINSAGSYQKWVDNVNVLRSKAETELLKAISDGSRQTGSLANALDDARFPKSATAVRDAGKVNDNNCNGLDLGDPQLPNAVTDYAATRNGTKFVKGGESWKDYFTSLKNSGLFNGFESHHIFPVDLFKTESFRKWYELVGYKHFNINGESALDNLIMLEKKIDGKGGVHTRHDAYTDQISAYFDKKWAEYKSNPTWDDLRIAQEIDPDAMFLARSLKKYLLDNSVKGAVEVNSIKLKDVLN